MKGRILYEHVIVLNQRGIFMNYYIILPLIFLILAFSNAEARSIPDFTWEIDEKYQRDGNIQFFAPNGSHNILPIGIRGLNDVTVTLHPTINFDQTGKAKLPKGVNIYFEPSEVTVGRDEVKVVNLVIDVAPKAPANLYDVQIVGTWKKEGMIPDFTGTSFRLHVGQDFGAETIPINMLDQSPESFMGQITWSQAGFSELPGTKATLTVTDQDMNKYPNGIDFVWVQVFSDSDGKGFRTTLFETDTNSGVFQGVITLVNSAPSGRGFLYISDGDTITAKYKDDHFPPDFSPKPQSTILLTDGGIELYSTAIVGRSFPPMERVPASDLRLLNREGTILKENSVLLDQQIQVVSDLKNQYNKTQPFAYLVQITNNQNQVESLSWISGNLTGLQEVSPALSWIPIKEGVYEITVFVWESITNPTALAPPLSTELRVR